MSNRSQFESDTRYNLILILTVPVILMMLSESNKYLYNLLIYRCETIYFRLR